MGEERRVPTILLVIAILLFIGIVYCYYWRFHVTMTIVSACSNLPSEMICYATNHIYTLYVASGIYVAFAGFFGGTILGYCYTKQKKEKFLDIDIPFFSCVVGLIILLIVVIPYVWFPPPAYYVIKPFNITSTSNWKLNIAIDKISARTGLAPYTVRKLIEIMDIVDKCSININNIVNLLDLKCLVNKTITTIRNLEKQHMLIPYCIDRSNSLSEYYNCISLVKAVN